MRITLQQQQQPLVTRFAPSPTGYLHLGHVASMAFVYGIAKAVKAKLILRIEDHDQGRSRKAYEEAIFEDLEWLGFRFDEQPARNQPHSLRQSDRHERYSEVLTTLTKDGYLYRCVCTRAMIQSKMNSPQQTAADASEELHYSGICRKADLSALESGFGIRMITPDREIPFTDGILGMQVQNPSRQCGDFLLRDRHGHFTYQFAAAVDDFDQGVNLVIRGEDILPSTGRQILTGERLGRKVPAQFVHHPLLRDESGKKLGKRFFSEAIGKKRAEGLRPEELLGQAMVTAGLIGDLRPFAADELASLFEVGFES